METVLLGLCIAFLLVQAFYTFYFFLPLYFHRKRPPEQDFHPVSVLVCARNEHENLRVLVPALLKQEYPQYELILINDRSTDLTGAFFEEVAQRYSHVRVVKVTNTPAGLNPKKYALTLGIRTARYEHLLLTDADCHPSSPYWIRDMVSGFATGAEIILGYSPYKSLPGFLNQLIRYETLLTAIQYLSFAIKGQAYMGVGRNLAYTKSCFYKNKGFASHIKVTGGDDDLFVKQAAKRCKVAVVISKESQTESIPKNTFTAWFNQKRRHLSVGRLYSLTNRLKIGAFMLSNVFFYASLVVLGVITGNWSLAGILFALRCTMVYTVFVLNALKLNERLAWFLLPVLDVAYFTNYLFLGVSVLLFKKVRWK